MATTITHEEAKRDSRYKILKNGAIYDLEQGRIIANPGGGTTAITHATSSEYRTLWREKKVEAKLRGLARGAGIDPDDIDRDLVRSAASAAEVVTAHMAQTFLSSRNLRGMGETYVKLMGDEDVQDATRGSDVQAIAGAVKAVMAVLAGRKDEPDVIEAEAE